VASQLTQYLSLRGSVWRGSGASFISQKANTRNKFCNQTTYTQMYL